MRLDPEQLAQARRIDEASVDVEFAWEERTRAERSVVDAEVRAAVAIQRLLAERLAFKDVVLLTGLEHATVRRLRRLESGVGAGPGIGWSTDIAEFDDTASAAASGRIR